MLDQESERIQPDVDCDAVFDALTQGQLGRKVSLDQSNIELASHLNECRDCRTMVDSLYPTVEMLHNSAFDFETANDAASKCRREAQIMAFIHAEEDATFRESSPLYATQSPAISRQSPSNSSLGRLLSWQQIVNYVVVPALLFLIAGLFWRHVGSGTSGASASGMPLKPVTGSELLVALMLPDACHGLVPEIQAHKTGYVCCTTCHSAVAEPISISCMTRLSVACNACHAPNQTTHACCNDCHATMVDVVAANHRLACDTCHESLHSKPLAQSDAAG